MRSLLLTLAASALLATTAAKASAATVVYGTVGPGFSITLKTASGKVVKTLPHGLVTFKIRDRSHDHDFHLVGPGVDRSTEVESSGSFSWTVTLRAGKTYTYKCDPHEIFMIGRFKAT